MYNKNIESIKNWSFADIVKILRRQYKFCKIHLILHSANIQDKCLGIELHVYLNCFNIVTYIL